MTRRGFALLTVLWMLAVMSMLVGGSLQLAREGSATSQNRIALARAGWAREACLEILLARFAENASTMLVDTVDLGRGTWCRAELEDFGARLDVNQASADALQQLIRNDSLVDALLDWRDADDTPRPAGAEAAWYLAHGRRLPRNGPLASIAELSWIRGFGKAETERLVRLLTTGGPGRINLNAAPPELLATLPGFSSEAVYAATRLRAESAIQSADQLLTMLSPPARSMLLENYQEFSRLAAYQPVQFEATVVGGVKGAKPVSRASITLAPALERLAVIRRRTE